MEGNSYVDLFLTKGDEYIMVIGFLLAFVIFWQLLKKPTGMEAAPTMSPGRESWFQVLSDRFYHRGHAWALPQQSDLLKIGMDDFSQMLVGRSDKIDLPRIGSKMVQTTAVGVGPAGAVLATRTREAGVLPSSAM